MSQPAAALPQPPNPHPTPTASGVLPEGTAAGTALLRVAPLARQVQDVVDGVGGCGRLAIAAPPAARHLCRHPRRLGFRFSAFDNRFIVLRVRAGTRPTLWLCAKQCSCVHVQAMNPGCKRASRCLTTYRAPSEPLQQVAQTGTVPNKANGNALGKGARQEWQAEDAAQSEHHEERHHPLRGTTMSNY